MARGTQHRKRRPAQNARAAAVARAPQEAEAAAVAGGAVLLAAAQPRQVGVRLPRASRSCSGSCCSASAPARPGSATCSRTPSTSARAAARRSARSRRRSTKHPQDATAWRDLATAYEQKQRTARCGQRARAVHARCARRTPDALGELASQYTTLVARPTRPTTRPRSSTAHAASPAVAVRAGRVDAVREDLQRPERAAGPDRRRDRGAGADEGADRARRTTRARRRTPRRPAEARQADAARRHRPVPARPGGAAGRRLQDAPWPRTRSS